MTEPANTLAGAMRAWMDEGRALADQRRALDWSLADWMEEGKRSGHLSRIKWPFLSESVGMGSKRLKDLLKAATAFPPAERATALSVEHHATIAGLPKDKAAALLERAMAERLAVQSMREAVTQHRYETGERFNDEDTDTSLATMQIRAWNRATPEARAMAFEHFQIAAANGLGIVDEDEAGHA
jgi:hypothetical protein